MIAGARRSSQAVQQQSTVDDPDVAVGLRVVAEPPLGERIVLLRQQTRRAGAGDHLLEEFLRVRAPPGAQVGLDEPGAADVEAALTPGQPVIPAVAVDDRSAA